uniref:DUF4774 domain-containing protein n=1 Tax=Strongyloides stercoralis TaxID=6248 RepID=A0A0K0E4C3_STRER
MKFQLITILLLKSLTSINGQVQCCYQRVLITPASSMYVNIVPQTIKTPVENQRDQPIYQNPYNYPVSGQGINNNKIITGPGPVITSTQTPSTTSTSFGMVNAVPWNGNQNYYANETTLNQIYRDPELNEQNLNRGVNNTSQGTTQNINQYYQGVNSGWVNTNTNTTTNNSNNLPIESVANNNSNWTASYTQDGNINNTSDITTNEFSDSGYIQVSGEVGANDLTTNGQVVGVQTNYQGTTVNMPQSGQNQGIQSQTTGIYHNPNTNYLSSTQSNILSPSQEMESVSYTSSNNDFTTNPQVNLLPIYTGNPINNQENTINSNQQVTSQTNQQPYFENSPSTQSTLSYINNNNNNNYPSTTQSSNLGIIGAGIGAGVAGIVAGGNAIGDGISNITNFATNTTVFNPSTSPFSDADTAPITHDTDYKYSDSGYITVGVTDDNGTISNQSGNSNVVNSNVNNESNINLSTQGTTIYQVTGNQGIFSQSTESLQNELRLSTESGQYNQETSTTSNFNQQSTMNQENIYSGSTSNNINIETTDRLNEIIDNTSTSSTLLRDSTNNDGTNSIQNDATITDTTTEHQNSGAKITGLILPFALILHFLIFN